MKPFRSLFVICAAFLLALVACNRPIGSAPTPFTFPTPDLTLTAIFAVLNTPQVQPATPTVQQPVLNTPVQPAPAVTATSLPVIQPTNTFPPPPPTATNTQAPLPTAAPTATPIPERPRGHVIATYLSSPPNIDANLDNWNLTTYSINENVFGSSNWYGAKDSSGKFMVGWDEDYLYLAIWVSEDLYIQMAEGENLYKGDSIEILIDSQLGTDYYSNSLSGDDYQLGISPGKGYPGNSPSAYLWFPSSIAGGRSKVLINGKWTEQSYQAEIAVPWDTFNISPQAGQRYGFALSLSDSDTEGRASQDSMVSNITTRILTDPTTWGDLSLKK
jgi:hypothetical protein